MYRTRVLAGVAAAVIAVVGLVAFRQLTADGTQTSPVPPPADIGIRLDLPTSSWEPGDAAMEALDGGVLRVDRHGCVFLEQGSARGYAAWPAGYEAYQPDSGEVTLYAADGDVVARDGDQVRMGGGWIPVAGDSAHRCLPDVGEEYFVVGYDVRVVRTAR